MIATDAAIEEAIARGDVKIAVAMAKMRLEAGERSVWLLNLAAFGFEQEENFAQARTLLEEALVIDPSDPLINVSLGAILRAEGRMDEAVAQLTRSIPFAGHVGALWLERAFAFETSGDLKAAERDFRTAVKIEPSAPGYGGLAGALARLGHRSEARKVARQALGLDPKNAAASIAIARCDLADGNPHSAIGILASLTKRDDLHRNDRLTAMCLLGDAHDRMHQHDSAYSAYRSAKENFAHDFAAPAPENGQRAYVEALGKWLPLISNDAAEAASSNGPLPVFLIGFPRSGTTLVENILASIPRVFALEERPTLRAVDTAFLREPDGLRAFSILDETELDGYRTDYWQQAKWFGLPDDAHILVDMDPLKGIKLPVIAKLFPEARIVMMRRDPRDVVWSCFKTPFAPSAAAFEFTSIERAASHYSTLMDYQEQCLAALQLNAHVLRYEALVTDFDAETQKLCKFLGLDWSDGLRDFAITAKKRGVATASAGQVERGLYDGRGQWRDYARYMAPAMPILAPWIARFGYELDR